MRRLLTCCLFLLPWLASAQVSFEASVETRRVAVNSYFDIAFTLKNARGDDFKPPTFEGFEVIGGPFVFSHSRTINNQTQSELGYTYTLAARRTGQFTIGAALIKVDGKVLRTKPITIEVIAQPQSLDNSVTSKLFLRAIPKENEAFVGQQIILDYKLYTAVDVESYSILEEADYQGFYAEDLRRFDSPPQREVFNGRQYVAKIIKRVALFPQQAGLLRVLPLKIEVAVITDGGANQGSFLFGRDFQRTIVESDSIKISVKPLPNGAPATFSGAVGNFEANYTISRTEASTDNAISLRLVITGDGDIKRVQAPQLLLSDSLESYDPRTLEEVAYETFEGKLTARKEFEYLLQPKFAGAYRLQPKFTFFDPYTRQYATLGEQVFDLNIQQGTIRTDVAESDNPTVEKPKDIRGIKSDARLQMPRPPLLGKNLAYVLALLPLAWLGGVVLYKRHQYRRGEGDATQLRIRRARQEALRHLQVADKHLAANDNRAFFEEVSKALLGYVCDKLQIPRSALTKNNVREQLQQLQVAPELIDNFMNIIQTCEVALYSSSEMPAAMQETYRQALDNIAKIEAQLKK